MQIPAGSHPLNVTSGGPVSVTIFVNANGTFNAFGRLWTYDPLHDWYVDSKDEMHIRFTAPPMVFAATWGTDNFGGTWS